MKTIYYFLFIILISLTAGVSFQKSSKNVILRPVGGKITSEQLEQSAGIISSRLKLYDMHASVSLISDKGQIKVQLPAGVKVTEIAGLLTARGSLGFYETLTAKEISDLTHHEFSTLPSDAKLVCTPAENEGTADSVRNILGSANLLSGYRLLWKFSKNDSLTCLYAVSKNAALTRADIEDISSRKDPASQSITVSIRFKPASRQIWAETTGRNLNKPLAMVIDDKVFYTPVVKTTMENGLCEITGNFTEKEVNYFLALVNNDILPVSLVLN